MRHLKTMSAFAGLGKEEKEKVTCYFMLLLEIFGSRYRQLDVFLSATITSTLRSKDYNSKIQTCLSSY
ncbi:hypothetical protein Y1Q_0000644 [Alligator mississippiensis]|uniref:Uncharacterized protein n=1 Tax=Alligator mississippiensis TaxID=8496 RepID=A0A151MBZ2_ALLMI|nr:hypothetical protein Y1Q_0000644 [Alligator mississippiensis]